MQILSNPISALNVRESSKFLRLEGNRGRGTESRNTAVSRMCNEKYAT